MPNVKNRRLVIDGTAFRWSSIGGDNGIQLTVALEGENRRLTGRRVVSVVPHNVLVLPSVIRRLIDEARAAGWDPNQPIIPPFHSPLAGPFLDAPDRRKRPRAEEHDDEEYLAAIRAAPDDDAPRLVYADVLLERGDARGEMIILSCMAAARELTKEERLRLSELVDEHEVAWLGPLSYVTRARIWRRGFLHQAELTRRERGVVAPAVGDARWWSVERLEARSAFLADRDIASIIAGAGLDDLGELFVDSAVLDMLAREGDAWIPRQLYVSPGGDIPVDALIAVAASPRLRHIHVWLPLSPSDASRFARAGLSLTVLSNAYSVVLWQPVASGFDALYVGRELVR